MCRPLSSESRTPAGCHMPPAWLARHPVSGLRLRTLKLVAEANLKGSRWLSPHNPKHCRTESACHWTASPGIRWLTRTGASPVIKNWTSPTSICCSATMLLMCSRTRSSSPLRRHDLRKPACTRGRRPSHGLPRAGGCTTGQACGRQRHKFRPSVQFRKTHASFTLC